MVTAAVTSALHCSNGTVPTDGFYPKMNLEPHWTRHCAGPSEYSRYRSQRGPVL